MSTLIKPFVAISAFFLGAAGCVGTEENGAVIFSDKKFAIRGLVIEDEDISAVARGPDGLGILAADEGAIVQGLEFASDGRSAEIISNLPLSSSSDEEIDIEGAAWMDGWFYVTGSHGASRKKGEFQESRYRVYRFRDQIAGGAARDLEQATLTASIENDSTLKPFLRRPLQRRGLNVEGLAARDGALYFGLRSPNIDGDAFVLEVTADALFGEDAPELRIHRLQLGAGLGIRDLAAFREGFLVLAGNAGSEPTDEFPQTEDYVEERGYFLDFWVPGGDVRALGPIPAPPGKAEAILPLPGPESDGAASDILVLFDGPKGAAPTVYRADLPRAKE